MWRDDPGLSDDWDDDVARVFARDLVGDAPDVRVGTSAEALVADSGSYLDGRDADRAFDALRCPVLALTAQRGMGASDTRSCLTPRCGPGRRGSPSSPTSWSPT
jgi:hypothetical protein